MNKLRASLLLGLVASSAGTPLAAQIKTFVPGQRARAAEVNQNFQVVKGLADTAKSTADSAKTTADTARSLADSLKTRTDLTGANIVDDSLEARDIKPNIVSSVNSVTSDGGNIDLVAGGGVSISSSNTTKRITISATPFNGGTLTNQLTVSRSAGTAFQANISNPTNATYNIGLHSMVGSLSRDATAYGVQSNAYSSGGGGRLAIAVHGTATNANSGVLAAGIYGQRGSTGSNHYSMYSDGRFVATGSKSFIHPHPKDPDKLVEFVCLEGNESGTYFRGTGRVKGGVAEIEIPEEWKLVTAKEKLTVHLTPIRSLARIAVWEMRRERITVRADEDCEFSYIVHGLRRGFENHRPIKPNGGEFRPKVLGVPYGQQYSRAYRNLLVENGTLNSDYTPNVQTAMKRGWVLREPTEEEVARAHEGELLWQKIEDEKLKAARAGK